MSLWIQHGYGKGDKISRVISQVGGVVLSPADERPSTLLDLTAMLTENDAEALLDPQLYVANIENGEARHHADHGLTYAKVDWSAEPQVISDVAKAVVAANATLGLQTIVAPAPLQRALGDKWAPLGLQFARAVQALVGTDRTLASVVLHEVALTKWNDVDEWLTSITKLDVAGFYVLIVRSAGADYPASWDVDRLTNLCRALHRLVVNDYRVVVGYTDIDGLGFTALGTSSATGWFHSMRRFQEAKWKPSDGGSQALPRVLSDRLYYPIRLEEARDLIKAGEASLVSSRKAERDAVLGAYDITASRHQYLHAMARLATEASRGADTRQRVERLLESLREARKELNRVAKGPVPRGLTYRNQLDTIGVALRSACVAEGVLPKP